MAEVKNTEIKLIAVERGFYGNRMIEPGQGFMFDAVGADGKDRKLPKWAAKPSEYKAKPAKPVAGDLKPKETQAAVKTKMATLTEQA